MIGPILAVFRCLGRGSCNARKFSTVVENLEKVLAIELLVAFQAMEFLRADECVEVTPHAVRLRKVALDKTARVKLARAQNRERAAV